MTGIDELEKIADPAERAREIGQRLKDIPDYQARLRQMRQSAILEMRGSGMSYAGIAAVVGLHRNRIQQIAEGRTAGGQGGDSKAETDKPPTPRKTAARARKTA